MVTPGNEMTLARSSLSDRTLYLLRAGATSRRRFVMVPCRSTPGNVTLSPVRLERKDDGLDCALVTAAVTKGNRLERP